MTFPKDFLRLTSQSRFSMIKCRMLINSCHKTSCFYGVVLAMVISPSTMYHQQFVHLVGLYVLYQSSITLVSSHNLVIFHVINFCAFDLFRVSWNEIIFYQTTSFVYEWKNDLCRSNIKKKKMDNYTIFLHYCVCFKNIYMFLTTLH